MKFDIILVGIEADMIKFPTDKNNLLIIDFEATCAQDNSIKREEMEIIEFACIMINKSNFQILKEFSEFIKPKIHTKLTEFCIELTSITQNDVDQAKTFPEVLELFIKRFDLKSSVFVSWGDYDKKQLIQDCNYHSIPYPFSDEHINVKKLVANHLNFSKPKGIDRILQYLNLEFIGTPQRGIDDIKNIIQILKNIR